MSEFAEGSVGTLAVVFLGPPLALGLLARFWRIRPRRSTWYWRWWWFYGYHWGFFRANWWWKRVRSR
jgi:hypothetical protein